MKDSGDLGFLTLRVLEQKLKVSYLNGVEDGKQSVQNDSYLLGSQAGFNEAKKHIKKLDDEYLEDLKREWFTKGYESAKSRYEFDEEWVDGVEKESPILNEYKENDLVNNPSHYTADPSGVECIEVTRHRNFNIGNAIKYLWRNGLKDGNSDVQDLSKAVWYIKDEIERLSGNSVTEDVFGLTQGVFKNQDLKWKYSAVDADGSVYLYTHYVEPEDDDFDFIDFCNPELGAKFLYKMDCSYYDGWQDSLIKREV